MEYRHEHKFLLDWMEYLTLRARLRASMRPDSHAGENGEYFIRSLYFDDPEDTALYEKLSGVDRREKFRIRYYNRDPSYMVLEKKSKRNGLSNKQSAPMSAAEASALLNGGNAWMAESGHLLIREFYMKLMARKLSPKTVVDYTREPFVFPAGNVRITLDRDIRTGAYQTDFLRPDLMTLPISTGDVVLEVKYDAFLPGLVRDLIQGCGLRETAMSKYAHCRIYG